MPPPICRNPQRPLCRYRRTCGWLARIPNRSPCAGTLRVVERPKPCESYEDTSLKGFSRFEEHVSWVGCLRDNVGQRLREEFDPILVNRVYRVFLARNPKRLIRLLGYCVKHSPAVVNTLLSESRSLVLLAQDVLHLSSAEFRRRPRNRHLRIDAGR